jgi:hypothetical protein
MSYLYNNVPIIPGAYLVNAVTASENNLYQLPIFGSVSNLISMGFRNLDNIYYIMPGYKIEIYDSINYISSLGTIDNTNGTKILYQNAPTGDSADSIKMFYKGVEIQNKYTYASYSQVSGTPVTNPTSTLTIGSHKTFGLSLFPGAYIINGAGGGCMPIFFSISSFNAFLNDTADIDDNVLVMPGYKLILYRDSSFTGSYTAIENTSGTTIIVGILGTLNTTSSCKLFFNGNEVNQTDIVSE